MGKKADILNSWKEIADYLERDMRTCLRWEKKLGLPVHRYDLSSSRSKVFAYKSEIDSWLAIRTNGNEAKQKFPSKRIKQICWAAGIILILVISGFYFLSGRSSQIEGYPTLAVFPFENMDPALTEKYFSESMTHEVIDNFINSSRLRVIPAATINNQAQFPVSKEKIGESLGADYLLQARVDKEIDYISLDAELLRTRDGKIVWQKQFEGSLNDIFSIQDTLIQNINQVLNCAPNNQIFQPSENIQARSQAVDSYLKGNFVLHSMKKNSDDPWLLFYQGKYYSGQNTRKSNNLAISLFENAIEVDKNFASAYFGLAECYINVVNLGWDIQPSWLTKAETLIEQGHSLSPDHPGYYGALIKVLLLKEAAFQESLLEEAFQLARLGIESHPYNVDIKSLLGHCHYLRFEKFGRPVDFEQALSYKEQAFLQEPFGIRNIVYAELLMLEQKFSQAVQVCEFAAKHDPSFLAQFRLGEIHYYSGNTVESQAIFSNFIESHYDLNLRIDAYLYLAMIAAQQGNQETAAQLMQKIERLYSPDFMLTYSIKMASIHAGLGTYDSALKHLNLFFQQDRIQDSPYIFLKYVNIDPNFQQLRLREDFQNHIKQWRNSGTVEKVF